jgi:CubicO group peptidase (beta-lactamase class C family)
LPDSDPELMQGFPPHRAGLVTHDNWTSAPYLRWGFQHVREIVPTARIGRGAAGPFELEHHLRDLGGVVFEPPGGGTMTVSELLESTSSDGFLVLHRGQIVTERYWNGMTSSTTHLLQSVSKSVAGTVAGIVAGRGLLDPEGLVTEYLPELADGSFEDATVRDVLDMRTGTRYDETYADADSDVRLTEEIAGWRPARKGLPFSSLYEQIAHLENARPHGERFEYRSILTDLLGWILERATETPYAELVSRELWSQIGAEHDAEITIHGGITLPDGGMCVTLRDLARFALLNLREGRIGDRQIVPCEWVLDSRHGDQQSADAYAVGEPVAERSGWLYRNQWWVIDPERGISTALGIHGQFAYINPPADVVCVKLSTWPDALDQEKSSACLAAFAAIAESLAG